MATCYNCGEAFETPETRKLRLYCTTKCQTDAGNRRNGEGKRIILAAKAWKETKSKTDPRSRAICTLARRELGQMLAELLREDREAGRGSAAELYYTLHHAGDGAGWTQRRSGNRGKRRETGEEA